MQMRDVIISVTGIQHGAGGPDSELTGMEGTRTSITVQPRSVVLSREGALNSTMEFEEGHKHYCLFETPFGAATMGVDTRRIRSRLDFHGGEMEIEYTLDVNQTIVGRNRFYIQVQEPKPSHTGDIRWPI